MNWTPQEVEAETLAGYFKGPIRLPDSVDVEKLRAWFDARRFGGAVYQRWRELNVAVIETKSEPLRTRPGLTFSSSWNDNVWMARFRETGSVIEAESLFHDFYIDQWNRWLNEPGTVHRDCAVCGRKGNARHYPVTKDARRVRR